MAKLNIVAIFIAAAFVGCDLPSTKTESESVRSVSGADHNDRELVQSSESTATGLELAKKKFDSLIEEYETQKSAFEKLLVQAETPKAKQDLWFDGRRPDEKAYAKRFFEFYEQHPTTESGVEALLWISGSYFAGEFRNRANDILFEEHIDREELGSVVGLLGGTLTAKTEGQLRRAISDSPHDSVKANASFAYAVFLHGLVKSKTNSQGDSDADGSPETRYVRNAKVDSQDAVDQYKLVLKEFASFKRPGDQKTLGERASKAIFALENLAIGQVAPDIVGEDLKGVEFKLSDYRGKIVVLDFWGDW